MIKQSQHFTVRSGKSVAVDTYTAFHNKGSSAIAHNYPTEREARQALNTFRYAFYQQG
jgi:hypothetical protein